MKRASILCVVGTRPEAIKLAPVILALAAHPTLKPVVVSTGQHRELLDGALADFDIIPDHELGLMRDGQSPLGLYAAALLPLGEAFDRFKPAAVVVQGDTVTALAAAQTAAFKQIPLVHVEAGLRTGVRAAPFPEEDNRCVIARLADLHFAPTPAAAAALLREGVDAATIHVTGNTGIDALHLIMARLEREPGLASPDLPRLDRTRPLLLVTIHRRENHGARLLAVADALAELAAGEVEIVLPLHPNPAVAATLQARLGDGHIHLLPPLGYAAFVALLNRADVVLTDSGGVQEEAPALGVPALVLRDVTERGEGIDSGNARLVGTGAARIVAGVRALLSDRPALARMAEPALPYGDGAAATRIVAVLARAFASAPARAELVHQA